MPTEEDLRDLPARESETTMQQHSVIQEVNEVACKLQAGCLSESIPDVEAMMMKLHKLQTEFKTLEDQGTALQAMEDALDGVKAILKIAKAERDASPRNKASLQAKRQETWKAVLADLKPVPEDEHAPKEEELMEPGQLDKTSQTGSFADDLSDLSKSGMLMRQLLQVEEAEDKGLPVMVDNSTFEVPYSERWAEELAKMMAGKDQTLYFVQTNGRQGSPVPFVAGGQPGELPFSPTRDDFPLVVSKKAEAPAPWSASSTATSRSIVSKLTSRSSEFSDSDISWAPMESIGHERRPSEATSARQASRQASRQAVTQHWPPELPELPEMPRHAASPEPEPAMERRVPRAPLVRREKKRCPLWPAKRLERRSIASIHMHRAGGRSLEAVLSWRERHGLREDHTLPRLTDLWSQYAKILPVDAQKPCICVNCLQSTATFDASPDQSTFSSQHARLRSRCAAKRWNLSWQMPSEVL